MVIPLQSSFQTPCGTEAAYGLIYRLLEANAPGGYFDTATNPGNTPITIYWTIGSKTSPNRCIPTNLNVTPDGSSNTSGTPSWNDGCDFSISNTTRTPVVPLDYGVDPWVASSTAQLGIWDLPGGGLPMRMPQVIGTDPYRAQGSAKNYLGKGSPEAIPAYPAQALTTAGSGIGAFNTISYLGSEFVIDGSQAQEVYEYLRYGDTVNHTDWVSIKNANTTYDGTPTYNKGATNYGVLWEFTGAGQSSHLPMSYANLIAAGHADGMASGSQPAHYFHKCTGPLMLVNGWRADTGSQPGDAPTTDHYVNIQQSTVNFVANVGRRINSVPPKIALLDGNSDGDSMGSGTVNGFLSILDSYLANAGLYYTNTTTHNDSGGCPANSISGCTYNNGSTGFVYDHFDADYDLMDSSATGAAAAGMLGITNPLTHLPYYQVLWTPHWEATNEHSYGAQYVGGNPVEINSLDNIATFLNQSGTGLMGECASIESYEGLLDGYVDFTATIPGSTHYIDISAHDTTAGGSHIVDLIATQANPGYMGLTASLSNVSPAANSCNTLVVTSVQQGSCPSGGPALTVGAPITFGGGQKLCFSGTVKCGGGGDGTKVTIVDQNGHSHTTGWINGNGTDNWTLKYDYDQNNEDPTQIVPATTSWNPGNLGGVALPISTYFSVSTVAQIQQILDNGNQKCGQVCLGEQVALGDTISVSGTTNPQATYGVIINLVDAMGISWGSAITQSNGNWGPIDYVPTTENLNNGAPSTAGTNKEGGENLNNGTEWMTVDALATLTTPLGSAQPALAVITGSTNPVSVGDTVEVRDSYNNLLGSTTVNTDGGWSLTTAALTGSNFNSPDQPTGNESLANGTGYIVVGSTVTIISPSLATSYQPGAIVTVLGSTNPVILPPTDGGGVWPDGGQSGAQITLKTSWNQTIGTTDLDHAGNWSISFPAGHSYGGQNYNNPNAAVGGEVIANGADYIIVSGGLATPTTNFLFDGPISINGLSTQDGNWEGANCTDPNYPANVAGGVTSACNTIGGTCAQFDQSGEQACMVWAPQNMTSEFAQVGDYHFVTTSGTVDDFKATTGTHYNPGSEQLATTWTFYSPGQYPDGAGAACDPTSRHCDNGWDVIDMGFLHNSSQFGTVVYIAGHDYQLSTVGSRVILDTLLNLGQEPSYADRAVAAPTIYDDPNGACYGGTCVGSIADGGCPIVLQPVFEQVTGTTASQYNYTWGAGSQWIFPKINGNLYEDPLVNTVGPINPLPTNTFTTFKNPSGNLYNLADAQDVFKGLGTVASGNRNIFTYFGGQVQASTSYVNGALQVGWVPSPVSYAEVTKPAGTPGNTVSLPTAYNAARCVDVLSSGQVVDGKHPPYFGLVSGTSDGVCDLSQSTQVLASQLTQGVDFGVSEASHNVSVQNSTANQAQIQGMLEVVQGYCFATVGAHDTAGAFVTPPVSGSNCNGGLVANNYAVMGGLVDGRVAVSGASAIVDVNDVCQVGHPGCTRPTVAYAAGMDGQLHAFYVSGGVGYEGPGSVLHYPNQPASDTFQAPTGVNWAASAFTAPAGGPMTELWSFMPATQLPLLSTNQQMVDSTVVVQDVLADFTGGCSWSQSAPPFSSFGAACPPPVGVAGVKEWHTVLVATTGGPFGYTGSEIFALDVSNPLSPVLLWDVVGTWSGTTGVSPVAVANGTVTGETQVTRYIQSSRGLPYPTGGKYPIGIYDYSNLGSSLGLAFGIVRQEEPIYPVFVETNLDSPPTGDLTNQASPGTGTPTAWVSPGTSGVEVLAVNSVNGQLLWAWQEPYNITGNYPSNGIPEPVTPVADPVLGSLNGPGVANTLLAGDFEGNVWELNPGILPQYPPIPGRPDGTVYPVLPGTTDVNPTDASGGGVHGAIFATSGSTEPITTNLLAVRMPPNNGALSKWSGDIVTVFGTDDSSQSFVNSTGSLYIVDLTAARTAGAAPADPGSTPFPLTAPSGERFAGLGASLGGYVFFSTASTPLTDPEAITLTATGNTYEVYLGNPSLVSLTGASGPFTGNTQANYGGVATYTSSIGNPYVVGSQAGQAFSYTPTGIPPNGMAPSQATQVSTHNSLYSLVGWLKRVF